MTDQAKRVLHVVWSGVGWSRLNPLLAHDLLPCLKALIRKGVHGALTTVQPQSPMQLAQTVLTGQPAYQHRYLHPLVEGNGRIRARTLASNVDTGLFGLLHRRKVETFWCGWPQLEARPGHPNCIHARYGLADWDDGSVSGELLEVMQRKHLTPDKIGIDHLGPFFPELSDGDINADPANGWLKQRLAMAGSLQAAAVWGLKNTDWQFASIRYDFSDWMERMFGDCHPPLGEPADPQRLLRYHYMVTGAYRFLDMMLLRLFELVGPDTLVMLHSEQGCADTRRPEADDPVHLRHRSSHADQGFVVLSGSGIDTAQSLWSTNLLDIAPTLLFALGQPVSSQMPGRVLLEAFKSSVPRPRFEATAIHTDRSADQPGPDSEKAQIRFLLDCGLISAEELENPQQLAADCRLFDALSRIQNQQPQSAIPLLEELLEQFPDTRRYVLHLARCYLMTGDLTQAELWIQKFLELGEPDLRSHLILGQIYLHRNETDRALIHFFQAEQLQPTDPHSHCQIAEAYRFAGKNEQAEDAYQRALGFDSDHHAALLGIAKIQLKSEQYEQAAESCLKALESNYRSADTHYHLGVALSHLEKLREAIQAFEFCLKFDSGRREAHQWLAHLYKLCGDAGEAAKHQVLANTTTND